MRRPLLIVLGLFALATTACGGGDAAPENADGPTSSTADSEADGSVDFTGEGSAEFCASMRAFNARDEEFTISESDSPEVQQQKAEKSLAELDRLADESPEEISGDLDLFIGASRVVLRATAERWDMAALTAEQQSEFERIQQPRYQEALLRLNAYVEQVCDIDVDGDGDTDGVEPGAVTSGG